MLIQVNEGEKQSIQADLREATAGHVVALSQRPAIHLNLSTIGS